MYYICNDCSSKVDQEYVRSKVRCPYCGGKVVYKDRKITTNVVAW